MTPTTRRPGRWSRQSTCWRGCPAGGSRCWARCSSWATDTRRATSGLERPRPGSSTGSSWSATGRPASLAARALIEAADRPAALAALESDGRHGDVVLVKASRGVELDLLVEDLVAAL